MLEVEAVVFRGVRDVEYRSVLLPDPGPMDSVVQTEVSGISAGTEFWYYQGRRPQDIRFLAVPGYQAVGRVSVIGADVQGIQVGDRVCLRRSRLPEEFDGSWMGSHLAALVAHAHDAVRIETPVSSEQAVFSSLAALALRGFRMLQTQPSEPARSGRSAVCGSIVPMMT